MYKFLRVQKEIPIFAKDIIYRTQIRNSDSKTGVSEFYIYVVC